MTRVSRLAPVLGLIASFAFVAACRNFHSVGAGNAVHPPSKEAINTNLPNIVLIITDDQGYQDVGFNGSVDIPTPHIDRIAHEGVRFTRGYVTYPVCGPSRAGLLTGRYQSRFGFDRNPDMDPQNPMSGLPVSEDTIAEILQRSDFNSMAVGKWHMGTHPSLYPRARGFDEFFGFLEGGHRYFPEEITIEDLSAIKKPYDWYRTKLLHNGEKVGLTKYLTDELSDYAVDFVERQSRDQPFFLYLAYNAPHTPLQATKKYLSRFDHIENEKRKTYAAMISAVDDGVGRVLDQLDASGMSDNTIVVFLSDNGGVKNRNAEEGSFAINAPLSGGKGDLLEGGIRVPFAIRWPDKLPAGIDYDEAVISLDILATIAGQTGVQIREERPLDGVDLVPFVTGEAEGPPHEVLFWRKFDQGRIALVKGDQKLINQGGDIQFYDLEADLGETSNLARARSAQIQTLRELHQQWNDKMADTPAFPPLGSWPPRNSEIVEPN